jgi:phosphoglycerol transferase MdoB-like AlkP superfamily enzyme
LQVPFLHLQKPDVSQPNYNVVVFLQESLGAEYVGCLNGLPLTPELDKLSKEGLLFTNLYCTGTRSVRGIEQVTANSAAGGLTNLAKKLNDLISQVQ